MAHTDTPGETTVVRLAKLEAILSTAVNAIITIDSAGRIESANPATTRLFGYATDELVGQNVKILMPEPYAAEHDGYLVNFRRTGIRKIIGIGREVTGRRKDGSTFPIHLAVSEVEVGRQRYFAGIITDLTERKLVEEELRDSNQRFLAAFDSAAAGIVQLDRSGRFTRVNKHFCDLVGYTEAELLSLTPRDITHADDRESDWDKIRGLLEGELTRALA